MMFNSKELREALKWKNFERSELLINNLINNNNINAQDEEGNTILHYAVQHNFLEIIPYLIANGADINIQNNNDNTPLHYAVLNDNKLEIVKLLIANGADINIQNNNGNSALHCAVQTNYQLEIINLLIKKRANINIQNNDGNSPLHTAAIRGHVNITKFLLKNNANINIQNNDGNSPLHTAAKEKNLEVINYLVKSGADINIQNNNGTNALVAIEELVMKKILNESYFSTTLESTLTLFPQFVNKQNRFGDSPLMTAIRNRSISIIHSLLSLNANLTLKNEDYDTAFSLSLIFLPDKKKLHKQLFNSEVAKIMLKEENKKEITTIYWDESGRKVKYVFTIQKEKNGEYTFSSPVISKLKVVTARIFVVDFAMNTNNNIQTNSLFELQSLDDSGLDGEEVDNHKLYLKQVFDQLLPDINYYYSGDCKRKTIFLNANHQNNIMASFRQCDSNINHKALQLFIAHVMCNLKNDGTVYPISKIYCSESKEEIIANIRQTVKVGNINRGVLKAFHEYQGKGNTFIDFTKEQCNPSHLGHHEVVFQENISRKSDENGKYNSYRALVVYFEDENYQQYNNAVVFSRACTNDYNSHNMEDDDYKEFFYCNPKYSTPSKRYLGIVPELVEIRKYNKQLFDFLNSFIPVVKIMNDYLQQPWNKEKEWEEKMKKEVNIFNNAADNALCARTKTEPFNVKDINNFIDWYNKNANNPSFTITAKSTAV